MRFLESILVLFVGASATVGAPKDANAQKQDLEKLLDATVPFAKQMLTAHGEFYPYGATMDANGKITSVGGYTGDEHPKSAEVIDLLKGATRLAQKPIGRHGRIAPVDEADAILD
jgi:hypothetical protein